MVLKRITLLFDAAPCVEKPQLGNIFILVTFLCGRNAWEKIFFGSFPQVAPYFALVTSLTLASLFT